MISREDGTEARKVHEHMRSELHAKICISGALVYVLAYSDNCDLRGQRGFEGWCMILECLQSGYAGCSCDPSSSAGS